MGTKIFIIKSKVSEAVYAWNGEQMVCIVGAKKSFLSGRNPGTIMDSSAYAPKLNEAYDKGWVNFFIGDAEYSVVFSDK